MEGVGVGVGSEDGDAFALKCVGDVCAGILVSCYPLALIGSKYAAFNYLPPGLRGLRTPLITGGSMSWKSTATLGDDSDE